MNKSLEDKILAYFEGDLDQQSLDELLVSNSGAQSIYEDYKLMYNDLDVMAEEELPNSSNDQFQQWLSKAAGGQEASNKIFSINWRFISSIAAIGTVLLACIYLMMDYQEDQLRVAMDQEIRSMMDEKSSSERIKTINVNATSYESGNDEERIIALLTYTLENDRSSNVRLAAVEALSDLVGEAPARSALIRSLSKESDGAVKVAIIDALSRFNNSEIKETFEKVTQDKSNDKFVIDEAHIKLLSLDQY